MKVYTDKKIIMEKIKNYVFDFPVDFSKYEKMIIDGDYIEFFKPECGKEMYDKNGFRFINITPSKTIGYKKNTVSGCYCKIY